MLFHLTGYIPQADVVLLLMTTFETAYPSIFQIPYCS
jgi:hypothetical protein